MSKNLETPTKLTEFAPLQQEEKPKSVSQFLSKFFKISKNDETVNTENNNAVVTCERLPTWAKDAIDTSPEDVVPETGDDYSVDINEGRSLPNVLKRISNLVALRSNNLQDYDSTQLKQYWISDSVSKECYECSEKFTTFRRKHHCRVCGQIFCSQCCNQQIPGKIFGCTGDLRVCTYCCKIVLSYLQSSTVGASLTNDLKVLVEDLQNKFGEPSNSLLVVDSLSSTARNISPEAAEVLKRKISVGYQEEKFASETSTTYLSNEEKCKVLQNSISLRNLFEELCRPVTGLQCTPHKFRLRTYPACFLGSELVDWLIFQQKAQTRVQAVALAQALLDANYIESFNEQNIFFDGYLHYKRGNNSFSQTQQQQQQQQPQLDSIGDEIEPSWLQIESHSSEEHNNELVISTTMPTSTSYALDLNVDANAAYLSRQLSLSAESGNPVDHHVQYEQHLHEATVVRPSEQRELAPESGWFNASPLREENGEKAAYEQLSETYESHQQSLLKQLLLAKGLAQSWGDILIPLVRNIITIVRPDKNHDTIELDIRHYVQFKKLAGATKNDARLISGIVCSKNVAHKEMLTEIENPKILLLQCPIVYQRTEGRLMSLEPVLMQEHEYLRHVAARIVALQPNIVLCQKNVSRLALNMLREHDITLVHNVKESILDRLARCLQADIVPALDAHIGRPRLGTCKKFFVKRFNIEKGKTKTLMFFDGLPLNWLGATVLLRGASRLELASVKQVASFLLFASYNWRLEKSFLMDEFAFPPNSNIEFLDDSFENSPEFPKTKLLTSSEDEVKNQDSPQPTKFVNPDQIKAEKKQIKPTENINELKKITSEYIDDFTDPLQSSTPYNNDDHDKFIGLNSSTNEQLFMVAELPFSNNFKKYLDDTILCISPYIMFPVPYLESDSGKKCKLRRFFSDDMFYSEQFENSAKSKRKIVDFTEKEDNEEKDQEILRPLHPFLLANITNIESKQIQNLVAHFRACGGQYQKKEILDIKKCEEKNNMEHKEIDDRLEHLKKDVLDPNNHQKLSVLFCSFSQESNNAPAFCVNPWVVNMDFYGRNDIPIGCFLERYCFRATYTCPSKTCTTPMSKHIRRFVHNSGCVTIALNTFDNEFSDENIVMWSWCTKCQSVSPVVSMSTDTWSYSFAKYLELRFHGDVFTRRGQNPCQHSLHHDHYQYFGYKNYVASFSYSSINIWEILLPSSLIEIYYDTDKIYQEQIEEARIYSQKGHELFVTIQEKLALISIEELETIGNIKEHLNNEQQIFKQLVEEVQLKLTSPSTENKSFNGNNIHQIYWKIQDSVTKLKQSLVKLVEDWNVNLAEAIKCDKKKERNSTLDLESPVSDIMDSKSFNLSDQKENSDDVALESQIDMTQPLIDDSTDGRKEQTKKSEKSVKTIFDKLLPSSVNSNLLSAPFSAQEHHILPIGVFGPIIVNEMEISSIIAYALNSFEYKELMNAKKMEQLNSSSPITKRKNTMEKEKSESDEKIASGILGFLRKNDLTSPSVTAATSPSSSASAQIDQSDLNDISNTEESIKKQNNSSTTNNNKNLDIEIQFQDATCNFFCRIYLAEKFAALRATVLPNGEEAYIRSLCRSVQWKARGGKSGSKFSKTLDDRFILKEMSKTEVQLFLEIAFNYFTYILKCSTTLQPTLLGKIIGVYQIIYRNSLSNVTHRSYTLVMENLFYNRGVSQKFDLKGSVRNRLVVPDDQEGEIVLLDENLLKMTCDSPLYVLAHSKEVLLAAIQNDTEFLSAQDVMDYSLLVGLDMKNNELVLGIIDYIRTFTWDKKLETMVKRSGILGGQGKLPTIISPEEYQKRFIEAMHKYFLVVPDHYASLYRGIDV